MKWFSLGACVAVVLCAAHARSQSLSAHLCSPVNVAAFDDGDGSTSNPDRVVVTCSVGGPNGSGANTITRFAVATSAAGANRFLTLATAAQISGRRLNISYDHTTATAGCSATNCRTPRNYTME
jgi:hypothetical protein